MIAAAWISLVVSSLTGLCAEVGTPKKGGMAGRKPHNSETMEICKKGEREEEHTSRYLER